MNTGEATVELTLDARADVPPAIDETRLTSLATHALNAEAVAGAWLIGVVMTSDDEIQQMHREFMGLDSPTDIMTFPYEEDDPFTPAELRAAGGDIVISVDSARTNAIEAGWSLERELEFLVLHGVLHLVGWDDATPEQRSEMLGRQRHLLASWLAGRD